MVIGAHLSGVFGPPGPKTGGRDLPLYVNELSCPAGRLSGRLTLRPTRGMNMASASNDTLIQKAFLLAQEGLFLCRGQVWCPVGSSSAGYLSGKRSCGVMPMASASAFSIFSDLLRPWLTNVTDERKTSSSRAMDAKDLPRRRNSIFRRS